MNPAALNRRTHTYISTVYTDPEAEAPISCAILATAYPNITAIRVRDADRPSWRRCLGGLAAATFLTARRLNSFRPAFWYDRGSRGRGRRRRYEAALLENARSLAPQHRHQLSCAPPCWGCSQGPLRCWQVFGRLGRSAAL